MSVRAAREERSSALPAGRPTVAVGVTHPQTCLVLGPRLRRLRETGFRVVLIGSPGRLLRQTAEQEQVEYYAIQISRGIAPWADLVSLIRLIRLLHRLKPNVTEFSTPKAGLLGTLAAALCAVPRRVYALRGLRLETTSGSTRRLLLWAERFTCACAHHVLCNSQSLRQRALDLRIVSLHKIQLIGDGSSNGVDMERFAPGRDRHRKKLGWSDANPVIGFVGRLTRDKGVPELLEAFDAIVSEEPGARLLLVGWFDASEDALSAVHRNRIEGDPRIHCTGFVHDAAPYYRSMDVMVLPTWREGFPNVVLEAQSSGVPVVTTLSTGSRDSVVPEITGLLISPGYPQAISEAVLRLLRNPMLRKRMGSAARSWVAEHYADRRVLGLTAQFYCDLVPTEMRLSQPQVDLPLPL